MTKGQLYLYGSIAAIILVAAIIFYFGRQSKKGGVGSKPIKPGQLPNSGSGIPEGWIPTPLADKLFKSLDGYNWTLKENGSVFRELALLSTDDQVAAVAIDYKNRHGRNLYSDIYDEMPVGLAEKAEYYKGIALSRLQTVNMI